ncbi:hypothetical protein TL16_g08372 [Triparma laevis f. inornata]|uniref:WW domain-containing protein n=2 Tax=Triparma laevis TaxID=1534972 RepID=A0A9W7KTN9_9STRA|nr:hypothetical protein TL16_g08372 [Triparma laevis f. inornata]GMI10956.1 hypothetical protein TrLO_g9298 [Triparma laevis f. longispina]
MMQDTAVDEEKQAQKAKRDAFKNRHAMFEKKEGPSEEEKIKTEITKASKNRRFEKQMKSAMASAPPGKKLNPFMMEMNLRNKIGNTMVKTQDEGETYEGAGTIEGGDEEVVEHKNQNALRMAQELAAMKVMGGAGEMAHPDHVTEVVEEEGWEDLVQPVAESGGGDEDPNFVSKNWQEVKDLNGDYWWNEVTNDTSYTEPACMVVEKTGCAWQVVENESGRYYWNVVDDDTSYTKPADCFCDEGGKKEEVVAKEEVKEEPSAIEGEEEGSMWTEFLNDAGEYNYHKTDDPSVVRTDKPKGTTLVGYPDGKMWQECRDEDDDEQVFYQCTDSDEVRTTLEPGGTTMIVCDANPVGLVESEDHQGEIDPADIIGGKWAVHQDEEGNDYYYCESTGESTYEKPAAFGEK